MKVTQPITHIRTNHVSSLIRKMKELDGIELPEEGNVLMIAVGAHVELLNSPEIRDEHRFGSADRIRVATCVRSYTYELLPDNTMDHLYALVTMPIEKDPDPVTTPKITDFNDPDIYTLLQGPSQITVTLPDGRVLPPFKLPEGDYAIVEIKSSEPALQREETRSLTYLDYIALLRCRGYIVEPLFQGALVIRYGPQQEPGTVRPEYCEALSVRQLMRKTVEELASDPAIVERAIRYIGQERMYTVDGRTGLWPRADSVPPAELIQEAIDLNFTVPGFLGIPK